MNVRQIPSEDEIIEVLESIIFKNPDTVMLALYNTLLLTGKAKDRASSSASRSRFPPHHSAE